MTLTNEGNTDTPSEENAVRKGSTEGGIFFFFKGDILP